MPDVRPVLIAAGLSSLGAAASTGARAAEWSIAPVIRWTIDHDTNRTFADQGDATQSGSVHLETRFERATETSRLAARPWLRLQRVSGDEVYHADEGALQLSATREGERTGLAASSSLARESTLYTEAADTGIVDVDSSRDTLDGSLAWTFQQTSRHRLRVQTAYADVRYERNVVSSLSDYDYYSASMAQAIELSPRTALSLSLFGSEVDSVVALSRDRGASLGIEHTFTPRFDAALSIGYSERRVEGDSTAGVVYEARATRRGELTTWSASVERGSEPSGFGFLVDRFETSLSASRAISPRLDAVLALHSARNRYPEGTQVAADRRYDSVDGGLDWRAAERLTVAFRLGGARAREAVAADSVDRLHASLAFSWTPRPRSISR